MARTAVTLLFAGLLVVSVAGATAGVAGGVDGAAPAATQECSFPYTTTDATGTEVTVEEEPQAVVTLNPSAAQTMWEIGAKDKVVGVTKYATYLEGASEKTNISGPGFTTVVTEKVVALEPDLVLVPNASNPEKVRQLREAGLTVFVFPLAASLDDISTKTRTIGRLVGECAAAEETVTRMESEIATVQEAVEGEERPDVLFVLGPSKYTPGAGTFIHTAIETAGGNNIAADQNITGYQPISDEVVAQEDPDWIVKPTGVPLPDSQVYNESTAVQEGRVLEVNRNFISQPAPQIVRAIRTMAKTFHPEAYAAANATPTPSPTPTASPTAPPTRTPTPTETGSPGFGPLVALAALAATLVLSRRR